MRGHEWVCQLLSFLVASPSRGLFLCLGILATRKRVNKFLEAHLICYLVWDTQAFSLYTTVTDHIDEDAAFLAVEAVLRFLSVKGLSSRHLPTAMHRTSIVHEHNLHTILSSAGGLLLDKRAPGDWVAAGDVLGEIVDPCTCRPLEQLRTDCRGRVFFCHRAQLINGHEVAFRVLPE